MLPLKTTGPHEIFSLRRGFTLPNSFCVSVHLALVNMHMLRQQLVRPWSVLVWFYNDPNCTPKLKHLLLQKCGKNNTGIPDVGPGQ